MSVTRLAKFDSGAAPRLGVRTDFAAAPVAAPATVAPQPDPHAVLFRNACARFVGESAAVEQSLRAEAAATLVGVIRAVAPSLLEAGAGASLETLMKSFSKSAVHGVEVRASAATIEMLARADARDVTLIADDELAPGDFKAAWPHGGMSRDASALIDGLLAALAEARGVDHG